MTWHYISIFQILNKLYIYIFNKKEEFNSNMYLYM